MFIYNIQKDFLKLMNFKPEDMTYMFHNCSNFNQELGWNLKNIKYNENMFTGTKLF